MGPRSSGGSPGHATVYDVATRAGVSTATVSRVLNGLGGVGDDTRARVQAAIAELNYVPNGSARGLGRQSTNVIGLVYRRREFPHGDPNSPPELASISEQGRHSLIFYDQLIRSVEEAAYPLGYAVLLRGARTDDELGQVLQFARMCDGMILMDRVVADTDIAKVAGHVPIAYIAHRVEDAPVTSVMVDNGRGVAQLLDHLVEHHGVRTVAFLGGPADNIDAQARAGAVVVAAAARGIELEPLDDWRGNYGPEVAYAVVTRHAERRGPMPDAIMCANDATASGALVALRAHGFATPGDIAVTGFDDMEIARLTDPPLTTIRQPLDEMARLAVDAVVGGAAGRLAQAHLSAHGELVVRSSCGCSTGRPAPSVIAPMADSARPATHRPRSRSGAQATASARSSRAGAGAPASDALSRHIARVLGVHGWPATSASLQLAVRRPR